MTDDNFLPGQNIDDLTKLDLQSFLIRALDLLWQPRYTGDDWERFAELCQELAHETGYDEWGAWY